MSVSATTLARAEPLTTLPRSARSRVSWSLARVACTGTRSLRPNGGSAQQTTARMFRCAHQDRGELRRCAPRNRGRKSSPRVLVDRVRLWRTVRAGLTGEFQSEREEETRDRAERGSAVRGSPCPQAGTRSERRAEEASPHRPRSRCKGPQKTRWQRKAASGKERRETLAGRGLDDARRQELAGFTERVLDDRVGSGIACALDQVASGVSHLTENG